MSVVVLGCVRALVRRVWDVVVVVVRVRTAVGVLEAVLVLRLAGTLVIRVGDAVAVRVALRASERDPDPGHPRGVDLGLEVGGPVVELVAASLKQHCRIPSASAGTRQGEREAEHAHAHPVALAALELNGARQRELVALLADLLDLRPTRSLRQEAVVRDRTPHVAEVLQGQAEAPKLQRLVGLSDRLGRERRQVGHGLLLRAPVMIQGRLFHPRKVNRRRRHHVSRLLVPEKGEELDARPLRVAPELGKPVEHQHPGHVHDELDIVETWGGHGEIGAHGRPGAVRRCRNRDRNGPRLGDQGQRQQPLARGPAVAPLDVSQHTARLLAGLPRRPGHHVERLAVQGAQQNAIGLSCGVVGYRRGRRQDKPNSDHEDQSAPPHQPQQAA